VRGQRVDPAKARLAREFRRRSTPEEDLLWQRLRRSQVGGHHARRQQVIDGFIVDFYFASAGLAVEVDGSSHDGRAEYDSERDALLARRGVRLLRLPASRVRTDIDGVLAEILAFIEERT
jgi:very-short-patch-repair endonuclease